jgi:hypothetical protein
MKRVIKFLVSGAIVLGTQMVTAQSTDEARMKRDIEIAENVLGTMIKQEFSKGNFFPVEVRGSYRAGYGVTFAVPTDMLMPMVWGSGDRDVMILDGTPGVYSYSFSTAPEPEGLAIFERNEAEMEKAKAEKEMVKAEKEMKSAKKEMEKAEKSEKVARAESEYKRGAAAGVRVTRSSRSGNRDSLLAVNNAKIIQAAKNFLADYGDMLSQLKADERIIITNQVDNQRWFYGQNTKRSILTVEASKGDLAQLRQDKISRDQFLSKIKVTNTESTGKMEPDLELLSSIFNRLYRSDLSKSFFIEGNLYYERLTDYGAIMYMQVYSSNQVEDGLWDMPTVNLREVDQAARDKKVKELYPGFESELKENILEYGRTLKSLKDTEQLVFNVTLTKCKGCGIPSEIEVSVTSAVLKEYNTGKLDKSSALGKISVKRGDTQ